MNKAKQDPDLEQEGKAPEAPAAEEFEILELEDRLELEGRCNYNCSCPM
jgi:hypothetical protein